MPVEIRELVIRTNIDGEKSASEGGKVDKAAMDQMKKRILEECKSYVNQKVREINER